MRSNRMRMLIAMSIGAVTSVLLAASPAQAATIASLESLIESHSRYVYWNGLWDIHTFPVGQRESVAVPVGAPRVVASAPYYLGCAKLINSTSSDQQLKSNAFSRRYTNTISTTVTVGVSKTTKVTGSFKFSEVVSVGAEESITVSYQTADTQTESVMEIHTAPSQNVHVPAGQTRYVVASLTPTTYSGTLALNTSFDGRFLARDSFRPISINSYGLYDVISGAKNKGAALPAGFSLNTSNRTVDFKGTGTYTMVAGVNFSAHVLEKLPSELAATSCA
ncbi:ETX/MTX2 family pore-forming toxin [Salinispora arenicola]|uniref:Toxin ETX/toxin MTX2 n=2 Tax=Salinispora arenicola TaxID=168697 RepID=A0A542XMC2_SALAC|nr:ETX/MTX2 family pore-forming toxin [Salinispora arenicola]TQL36950.1 toxin ETX/toxin MTX2 [Salinispora arenicola]